MAQIVCPAPSLRQIEDIITTLHGKDLIQALGKFGYTKDADSLYVQPNESGVPIPPGINPVSINGIFLSQKHQIILTQKPYPICHYTIHMSCFYRYLNEILMSGFIGSTTFMPFEIDNVHEIIYYPQLNFEKANNVRYDLKIAIYMDYFMIGLWMFYLNKP